MHTRNNRLALYTTMYRATLKYASEWFRSVQAQSASDFDLWIGLDDLTPGEVEAAVGTGVNARWVKGLAGSTPAQIRDQSLMQIVNEGFDVVLVDSDDILHPDRVASARQSLLSSDLAACALEIVDESGRTMNLEFNLDPASNPSRVLPRNNVFGFSNSAYRYELLERCLPIPSGAILVDWYLATRAWLFGANLHFDRDVRMKYRQYGANTARMCLPFEPEQIISDLALVRRHFELVLTTSDHAAYLPGRWTQFLCSARDIEQFDRYIHESSANLCRYADLLNKSVSRPIWWTSVAYAPLAHVWKQ